MKITIFGVGYVGLVSGICLANLGHEIIFVDKNPEKISALNNNIITIYEDGLEEIFLANLNKIHFVNDARHGILNSEAIFICVGTPQDNFGKCDLTYVENCATEIANFLDDNYKLIIIKSTVPIGTCEKIRKIIHEKNPDANFNIISNPEFLREGTAIKDFMHPDRIVIGYEDKKSLKIINEIYKYFIKNNFLFVYTNLKTSELIKYASNSFLALKLSFINEIADLCEKTNINFEELKLGIGSDPRIGKTFLNPGPGYGGSCLPKDTLGLVNNAHDYGVELKLIKQAIKINEERIDKIVYNVKKLLENSGKNITLFGLAFKSGTDDIRESPAIKIAERLIENNFTIQAYDPQINKLENENIYMMQNPYNISKKTNLIIIATEWEEFKNLDWHKIFLLSNNAIIYDLRNILDKDEIIKCGFTYFNIGSRLSPK